MIETGVGVSEAQQRIFLLELENNRALIRRDVESSKYMIAGVIALAYVLVNFSAAVIANKAIFGFGEAMCVAIAISSCVFALLVCFQNFSLHDQFDRKYGSLEVAVKVNDSVRVQKSAAELDAHIESLRKTKPLQGAIGFCSIAVVLCLVAFLVVLF